MHKDILKKQTRLLSEMEPDLIVWPEASTPYALNLDGQWIEALVDDCDVPLFLGSVVRLGEILTTRSPVYYHNQELTHSGMRREFWFHLVNMCLSHFAGFPDSEDWLAQLVTLQVVNLSSRLIYL